jgi:hypothetical protein
MSFIGNRAGVCRRYAPPSARQPQRAFARTAEELRGHVARLGAPRVAAVLSVSLDDLPPLLAGRVGVSGDRLRRLRAAELEG